MRAKRRGRPRKFKLGSIAQHKTTGQLYVLVARRSRGTKAEYRGIPVNGKSQRYGPATWMQSNTLNHTGTRSKTASVLTYRANQQLEREVGRGCRCQCCIHTAIPTDEFTYHGNWREEKE